MHRTQLSLKQKGNALFYVLLGVVLLAALSYTITRQNVSGGAAQQLSDDQAEIYAAQLINHANSVKAVIDQMLATGSTIDDIDFVLPGEAGYDTAPHIHKIFHPSGGGMTIFTNDDIYKDALANNSKWAYRNNTNIHSTPTAANDLIYSYMNPSEKICAAINKKITGSTDIPQLVSGTFGQYFDINSGSQPFSASRCPTCVGYHSLCVKASAPSQYQQWAFYNIVAAR